MRNPNEVSDKDETPKVSELKNCKKCLQRVENKRALDMTMKKQEV